ncbi:MAG: serine/threonine protein kinase [Bryobacterales bacterium]|nr:serine/threonine protein kinase [Bryobacterales bacterium]
MGSGSRKVEEIFARLLDFEDRERLHALEALCPDDPRTAAEVREMLEQLPAAESYFGRFPTQENAGALRLDGQRVGVYRITGELGRGGMGVVYRAERDDGQFARPVAIKFVSLLAAGGEAWRRFEREKRILAGLRHPNIAELLDAGVSEEGTPYIVMELVEGVAIDAYCRERRLSAGDRIRLIQQIAGAVDFIHRNLIVHRDIKPGNVLVTAEGVPKLLDFGISRMLPAAGEEGDRTAPERHLMTLNYASPEQLRGEAVSTGADVYSLGLLLYELLAGHQAYSLSGSLTADLLRQVLEEEPPRPGAGADLDQIVMKSIRKAPSQRYASARELAADLENYMAGRPVAAMPPAKLYRLGKWARRNRFTVTAGAFMALMLLAAGAAVVWQMQAARRERAAAERRFHEVRKLANSILFEFHDPIARLSGATEVRRLMISRSLEYLDSLARDSRKDVALQLDLVSAYTRLGDIQGNPNRANLGDTKGALASYDKARAMLEELLKAESRHRAASLELGRVLTLIGAQLVHVGRGADSLEVKRKALDHWERLAKDAPEDGRVWRGLGAAYSEMATATADQLPHHDRLAFGNRAMAVYEKLLEARPADPERMRDLATVHKYLSGMYQDDANRMIEHARAAVKLDEQRVQAAPRDATARMEFAQSLSMVATGCEKKGDLLTATAFARRSVDIRRALWEADPKDHRVRDRLAYALTLLGQFRRRQGDWRGALASLDEAIEHTETLVRNTDFYMAWHNLAWARLERAEVYRKLGSGDVCIEYRRAAEAYRRLAAGRKEYYSGKLSELQPKLASCGNGRSLNSR